MYSQFLNSGDRSLTSHLRALPALLLLVAAATSLAQAPRPEAPKFEPNTFSLRFMGMHLLSPARHWPSVPIGGVRTAGVSWGAIEPESGKYDWSSLDKWVEQAQAHHVDVTYVILNTPQWASTRPNEKCNRGRIGCAAPPKTEAWKEFITTLSTRYRGKIANYELWNEPNADGYWTGSPDDMVRLASIAYPIIKAADPAATVVTPSPSSTGWPTPYDEWLDAYLAAGGGKYADVIAWHGYLGRTNVPAEAPEKLVEQIGKVRSIMAKHGLGSMPLWNTEGGWGKDSQLPDQASQAAFLVRWYLIQFTHGVSRAFWYQWDNPEWGTLWREPEGSTAAAAAYNELAKWLDGVTASTPCRKGNADEQWTCDLQAGKNSYRVAWSPLGQKPLANPAAFASCLDLAGRKSAVSDKSVPLLGPGPVLLQGQ
jgi:hypothetical protein